ncbi:MAG: hypothetical protein DRJ03_03920 [Chloroflexi bacterium]|nr:MAG: hypothetical protein B6I35_01655 [Anaerolineaceae bacterium 4572_32.2]RLC80878.1 MAG: hypothetical protein DRI81_03675 [Chloroflexota bacterium]RLC88100.1 MAG: hypothetical protein DRJ03_03920 [Chloroflexota bacterium]HEY72684.1 hypothetical protein [Thermoflexia bacterium]
MTRTINRADDYLSRVLKHIPSEIVMAYVAIDGVLRSSYNPNVWDERETLKTLLWITLGTLTILTPFWMYRVMRVKRPAQIFISTLSVPVWLFALGGPFALLDWYQPAFGAIVLPLYTLIIPIITRS